jgi:hypothetical protein
VNPLVDDPQISLRVREQDEPGIEIRVNFGLFAGRHATPAEIDELAATMREFAPEFSIVAEERHEFADDVEAALHQVVIAVPQEHVGGEPDFLAGQMVRAANTWAIDCIASRHGGGEL